MLFNSIDFLFFFIVVYAGYRMLGHRGQNIWLLAASYFFYGYWNWWLLSLLVLSTGVNYVLALQIEATQEQKLRKTLVTAAVVFNLTLLGFFKYFNFFVTSFCDILSAIGFSSSPALWKIVLPVGISFYTFQALSYIIDVYRGEIRPTRSFIDFALFKAFFPQLVAGPIERAQHLLPQVQLPRKVTSEKVYRGCFLFFWGLFEKLYVSANMARITNDVFLQPGPYDGGAVLVALYAFAFQIFCDFDGYSNMAKGLGLMMGFDLLTNFNLPYFARNPSEFWQRWHISLSQWLRDYLYIPLGGNRQGRWKTYRNLMITMFLGGLWHGAAWTFIIWGVYQGFLLVLHRAIAGRKPAPDIDRFRWLKIIGFFHCVVLGWLFFRAESLGQINAMLYALVFNFHWTGITMQTFGQMLLMLSPLLAIQAAQYKTKDLHFIYHRHWIVKTVIYAFMTYLILGWGVMKAEEFIYFQF